METITKQTGAGEATIVVDYQVGLETVKAYLNGKFIGEGLMALKTPKVVNGKTLVAYCGKLGLTQAEFDAVKVAELRERAAWNATPAGIAAKQAADKRDRKIEADKAWRGHGDINKWRDA